MAKKYHQTRKDREDESRGMKKYWREHEGRKEGMDSRFMGMLSEDHSAPANLPQHVVHKYYPKCDYFDAFDLDDTIRGLDDTRDENVRKMERYPSDVKY